MVDLDEELLGATHTSADVANEKVLEHPSDSESSEDGQLNMVETAGKYDKIDEEAKGSPK